MIRLRFRLVCRLRVDISSERVRRGEEMLDWSGGAGSWRWRDGGYLMEIVLCCC